MKQSITLLSLLFFINVNSQCWQKISAGSGQSVVLQNDGKAWAWGSNFNGQLGTGTGINSNVPILSGPETDWMATSEGWNNPYTLAIKTNGTLWQWQNGANSKVQIDTQSNWSSIVAGGDFTVATKTNGTIWSWGTDNISGVLGNGTTAGNNIPTQIGTASWAHVAAGFTHVLAIKSDGTLWAWGSNGAGQIGDGTNDTRLSPVQVGTDNNWEAVEAGSLFSIAKKSDGTLWGWGARIGLGIGTGNDMNVPLQIGSDSDWEIITAGYKSMAAIKTDGTLWAWGNNTDGELGNGTTTASYVPIQIGTDNDWEDVDKGVSHTLAKKTNNSLWAWGRNMFGNLGDGTNITRTSPVMISCVQLSIDGSISNFPFKVAPNPVKDILQLSSLPHAEIKKVVIADVSGKKVITQYGNITDLNVEQLTPGIYILLIETNDNKSYHQKFIRQ
jgi:alpha-tubulin suppressor-like RCC1 family protein